MDSGTVEGMLKKMWGAYSVMPTTLHMPLSVYRAIRCGFRVKVGRKPTGTLRQRKRTVSYRPRLKL